MSELDILATARHSQNCWGTMQNTRTCLPHTPATLPRTASSELCNNNLWNSWVLLLVCGGFAFQPPLTTRNKLSTWTAKGLTHLLQGATKIRGQHAACHDHQNSNALVIHKRFWCGERGGQG